MFLQQLINGLTLGAVYALIALGYTMVYGILRLINFAHGEIYMIGAYLGIIILGFLTSIGLTSISLSLSIFITLLSSMIFCGGYAVTIEKIAYKPLRNAPKLSPLISAIGVSIFLQNFVMITQGATDKVFPPLFKAESLYFFNARITYLQILIFVVSLFMMAGLHIFVMKTKSGKAMRTIAQDKKMAALLGIDIDFVISLTFIIGSVLASGAGVMVGIYYGIVNHYIGYVAGIKAFTAAVLGGIGSIPGAMLGGIILGLMEALGASYISSEYKDAFAFCLLILILVIRPEGLLGQKGEEKA